MYKLKYCIIAEYHLLIFTKYHLFFILTVQIEIEIYIIYVYTQVPDFNESY